MAVIDPALHKAIVHQHGHVSGIKTVDGELTIWPASLGTFPTDLELQTWLDTYNALADDHPSKNFRADRENRANGAVSVPQLRAIVAELVSNP